MNDKVKLEQIKKKAEKRNKAGKYFAIFLTVIAVLFFLIMAFENLFNIKTISVNGISAAVPYNAKDVSEFLNIPKDTNLITYKAEKAEEALLYEFPYIKEIKIKKKLPSVLEINITENKGTLYVELGTDIFILSSEGRVLEIVNDPFYDGIKRTKLLTLEVKRCICGEDIVFDKPERLEILCEITKALEEYSMISHMTDIDTTDKFNVKLTYENRFDISFGTFEKADAKVKLLSEMMDNEIWKDSTGTIDISDPSKALVKFTGNVAN